MQKNSIDNLERKKERKRDKKERKYKKIERKKYEVKENQVKSTELPLDTIDSRLVYLYYLLRHSLLTLLFSL